MGYGWARKVQKKHGRSLLPQRCSSCLCLWRHQVKLWRHFFEKYFFREKSFRSLPGWLQAGVKFFNVFHHISWIDSNHLEIFESYVKEAASHIEADESIPRLIVGNKIDLEDQQQVMQNSILKNRTDVLVLGEPSESPKVCWFKWFTLVRSVKPVKWFDWWRQRHIYDNCPQAKTEPPTHSTL